MSSIWGNNLKISIFGESHGEAIGVVLDGLPAGEEINFNEINAQMKRRRPGSGSLVTSRGESDAAHVVSGLFEGKTTGTPISLVVFNKNQQSKDYSEIASYYRPGHADFTFDAKYGFRDYRGGGRSSGRETIGRVAAGAIACKILETLGIHILTYTRSIGPVSIDMSNFSMDEIRENALAMPDKDAAASAAAYLEKCMNEQNSSGGIIECVITGMPAGIGDPVFDKLDANLAKAILSIGAVKGFEIGDGFAAASATGLSNNDAFCLSPDGTVSKKTNHAGGVLGGMSDGSPILFRAAIKPTPSIAATQQTVNKDHEEIDINIRGRHDPIIVPRAVVVVESMAALTLVDLLLSNLGARMDYLETIYKK